MKRPRRRLALLRPQGAFTLIEFLVAAFLTLLVLGSAALGTTGAQRALRSATDTYTSARVAATVIDTARALGCGDDTDPQFIPATRAACGTEITGTSSTNTGDVLFVKNLGAVDGRVVNATVEYTTAWQPAGWKPSAADQCDPATTIRNNKSAWIAPQMLERRVTITIGNPAAGEVKRSYRQLSSAPERILAVSGATTAGLDTAELGGILVDGLASTEAVELSASGASGTIVRRVPSTCGAGSAVLFPYLTPGSYEVAIVRSGTRGSPRSFTVNANDITEVTP
jgi:type II secretory pathway pseudopilin PulG